jgi:hypothetical protein
MTGDADKNGKDNPTVVGRYERLPNLGFLIRCQFAKKQPDKENPDGKKKKNFYYRNDVLFQTDVRFYFPDRER